MADTNFPLTKSYCLAPNGKLVRKHRGLYPVNRPAIVSNDVQMLTTDARALPLFDAHKGDTVQIVGAELDESDDLVGRVKNYLVRIDTHTLAWAPPELSDAQCSGLSSADTHVCFNGD